MKLKLKQLRRLIKNSFPEIPNFYEKVTVTFEKRGNEKSFWSEIYIARLRVNDDVTDISDLPETLFIKVPRISENLFLTEDDESLDDLLKTLVYYTKKENLFYKHFPHGSIPNFPFPRVYYSEDIEGEGTGGLVAENLADEVYTLEHVPGLNDREVRRMMEALAGLHAHLLKRTDKSYVQSFVEGVHGKETFSESMQSDMLEEALHLERADPEVFGNGRIQRLSWAFDYEAKNKAMKDTISAVPGILVHLDMNVTNLMWRKGSEDLRAIIDYQMMMIGSVAHDIVRILTLTLGREERRKMTDEYIEHYYHTLSGFFQGNAPFSMKELNRQYSVIYPFASNFTLFGISLYIKMYADGTLGSPETMEQNVDELIDRARGIVEDMEALSPNGKLL